MESSEKKIRRKNKISGEKKKTFHPLRRQIAVLFIGLLLLSILAITVINLLFLEEYYISKKTEVLLEAVENLEQLDFSEEDAELEKEFIPEELRRESSHNNLSWIVIARDGHSIMHIGDNEEMLMNRLFGYAYNLDFQKVKSRILEETDHYVVQQVNDRFVGMDYVESWGILENGCFFLIRTPLESIRESVSISNDFYLFVGMFIIIVSGLVIWVITDRLTKPIRELTELSQRMSNLDFEAKYQSHVGNEIDMLGEHFNKMSLQLEKTVSELKSANNELQKDIEDKIKIDEMRQEFLNNVSHELKTPIALIQGYAEGLKENISDDPESREFYCDVIIDESAKMNKLVRNLLTLNHLESGADAVVMERFDLVSLIHGVLQAMNIVIQQKQVKVVFETDQPVYVWADEFKIEEVVTNYISNALNHVDGEREIEVKIIPLDDKVKVSVFNTGKPIPEEDVPNLWTKFYKVDKARTREYGGNGIGLSIVKAIMEGLHQEYGIENYENGVAFWFTLDTSTGK